MSAEREASCSCGALSLVCTGEPVRVSMCHCFVCQRRTGSVFGAQARFLRTQVRFGEGPVTRYVRETEDGRTLTFSFCPTCGSTVYIQSSAAPELVMVTVGAFSDPGFPPPTISIHESRQHGWVTAPADAEHKA